MPPRSAMTGGVAANGENNEGNLTQNWETLRANEDIQFAPVEIPEQPPREPGWLDKFFEWLSDMISPLGGLFGDAWPVIKWGLLAILIGAVLLILYRILEPLLNSRREEDGPEDETQWRPDEQESRALLEDADRLAAEGRFDEATHLLLHRSINQIANARPDWVEPSSTARELAALGELPANARSAFGLIAERVERSLFALHPLSERDWNSARAAYANFALARLDGASA